MPTVTRCLLLLSLAACAKSVGEGDGVVDQAEVPQVGWVAVFEERFHGVNGRAEILDDNTIELTEMHYDGGGINARLYLLADGEDFHRDYELSDNLVGEPLEGDSFVVEIPPEADGGDWNLITLWCVPAAVSFGHGTFQPPQDEATQPTTGSPSS